MYTYIWSLQVSMEICQILIW